MITEKSLGLFEKVGARFSFLDGNFNKRKLSAECMIGFSEDYIQFVARKTAEMVKKRKYQKLLEAGIPELTEANFHEIFDLAKKMRVDWALLMNVKFSIQSLHTFGFQHNKIGGVLTTSLAVLFKTQLDFNIVVDIVKKKFRHTSPSQVLKDINTLLREARRRARAANIP